MLTHTRIHTHAHTHTHIVYVCYSEYIYVCIYIYLCIVSFSDGSRSLISFITLIVVLYCVSLVFYCIDFFDIPCHSLMQVVSVDMETVRVHVRVKPHVDIDFSTIYGNWELAEKYYTSQEVCHNLRVSNLILSRISSSCSCEETKGGRYEMHLVTCLGNSVGREGKGPRVYLSLCLSCKH